MNAHLTHLARTYDASYAATHRVAQQWTDTETARRIRVLGDVARVARGADLVERCAAALDAIADVAVARDRA